MLMYDMKCMAKGAAKKCEKVKALTCQYKLRSRATRNRVKRMMKLKESYECHSTHSQFN
jgi:hypothetical protein